MLDRQSANNNSNGYIPSFYTQLSCRSCRSSRPARGRAVTLLVVLHTGTPDILVAVSPARKGFSAAVIRWRCRIPRFVAARKYDGECSEIIYICVHKYIYDSDMILPLSTLLLI